VGVSASLFDEMVADGRMPSPREINRRRVWDRLQIDAAFDDLPGGADAESETDSTRPRMIDLFERPERVKAVSEEALRQTYIEALGYDPQGMTEAEKATAEAKRIEEWTSGVLASPLWKKERLALTALLRKGGEWISSMHIKGASRATWERLEARGYVISKMGPWTYPDTGKPGPREGEHFKLTPEGEEAAQVLTE